MKAHNDDEGIPCIVVTDTVKFFKYLVEITNATIEKQNKISFLKTKELMNLVYRMLEHESEMNIVNELNLQGDYLDVRLK